MSSKKRKQETQSKQQAKRRKGEDGRPTPDSAVVKTKATLEPALPKVKLGKKEVVLNQNWNKVKASLPPPNTSRVKRLEKQRLAAEEEKNKTETAERQTKKSKGPTPVTLPVSDSKEPTKILALDCEMVGVGLGGFDSALARVTILNCYGNTIYDKFVKPQEEVVDYRTKWSGIRAEDLVHAIPFKVAQQEVADLIKGRIVVGHGLKSDFQALMLQHPFTHIRDTAKYRPLQRKKGRPHALRILTKRLLGVEIQSGEHDSGEDARAALLLYKKFKTDWEDQISKSRYQPKKKKRSKETKSEGDGGQDISEADSEDGSDK